MKSLNKSFKSLFYIVSIIFASNFSYSQKFKWVKPIGGTNADRLYDVKSDYYGNPISVGFSSSNFISGNDTVNNNGGNDIIILKQDKYGNYIWTRFFGSSAEDIATSVAVDQNNNIFVAGSFSNSIMFDSITLTSNGGKDAFILKLNSNGDVIKAISFGGTGNDACNDLAINNNGEIIIGGNYGGGFSFGGITLGHAGNNDVFFSKIDSTFNVVWLKGNGASLNDNCAALCLDQNGNIFATGQYKGQVFPPIQVPFPINCSAGNNLTGGIGGAEDVWVAKINGITGCYDWVKTIYGGSLENGFGIACDPTGTNCYAVGSFATNAFFDGTQYNSNGNEDGFLCKLSGSNGAILNVKSIGGSSNDAITSIKYTQTGLLLTGLFNQTISPATGISLSSQGMQDFLLAFYDFNGNCSWAISAGGGAFDAGTAVDVYNDKNIYVSGKTFSNAISATNISTVINPGNESGLILRVDFLPLTPSICVATVDSLGINNVIYWDKSNYISGDVFKVYRDIGNNNYAILDSVPFDSLSMFTDTLRTLYSANGNPNVSQWKYKISVTDTLGNESLLSPYHQTIFVQNNLANFSWNHYQIEGQITPVPALINYEFLRDTLNNGSWANIQTLSASSTSFTDPTFSNFQNTATYRIETTWNISCDPSRGIINTTRSNIRNALPLVNIGISENSISPFTVFPNPVSNFVYVTLDAKVKENYSLEFYDAIGNLLKQVDKIFTPGNIEFIDIRELNSGAYLLKAKSKNQSFIYRIIKY
jgi:hypothetical protein